MDVVVEVLGVVVCVPGCSVCPVVGEVVVPDPPGEPEGVSSVEVEPTINVCNAEAIVLPEVSFAYHL